MSGRLPAALLMVSLLLLGAALPSARAWLVTASGILFLGILAIEGARIWKARSDPYSLDGLRRVHEQALFEEADSIHIAADADVVCPACGTVFGSDLPQCPVCRPR